ncbi:MAG TPA: hypothetical protein VGM88_23845 [Kofleriaceae bacterium]|jgi:hypothetical protein
MTVAFQVNLVDDTKVYVPVGRDTAWLRYWMRAAKKLDCKWVLNLDDNELAEDMPPECFPEVLAEFVLLRDYFNSSPREETRPGDGWFKRLSLRMRFFRGDAVPDEVRTHSEWIVQRLLEVDRDKISKIFVW